MSELQWYTPRAGSFVSRNSDHRYGIGMRNQALAAAPHEAFYVEALYATPLRIGAADSISQAQGICQRHHDQLTTKVPQ